MAFRGGMLGLLAVFTLVTGLVVDGSPDEGLSISKSIAQTLYRLPDGRVVRLKPGQRIRRVRRKRPVRRAPKNNGGFGGFLNSLFGSPKPSVRYNPPASQEYLNRYVNPGFNQAFGLPPAKPTAPRSIPGYRTMCVRKCDGYYFPISFSTTRSKFGRDERTCRNRCNTDVALYYMRPHETDASKMVNRRGQRYSKLKNAFLYRKSYKAQCQCRPDPWTDAAKRKHKYWAKAEENRKARKRRRKARQAALSLGDLEPVSAIIAPKQEPQSADAMEEKAPAKTEMPMPIQSRHLETKQTKPLVQPRVNAKLNKAPAPVPGNRRRRETNAIRTNWMTNSADS